MRRPRLARWWSALLGLTLGTALWAPWTPVPVRVRAAVQGVEVRNWDVADMYGRRRPAVVVLPTRRRGAERWPVVVAFHGLGESRKGAERGARAWVDDYGLLGAYAAISAPPLSVTDFGGLVRKRHLVSMNRDLAARAFRGVAVVGVYTPDLMSDRGKHPERIAAFANWVVEELLRELHEDFPVTDSRREATGVDGVSLGGFVALSVGFHRPDAIGVVGAMQPAVRGMEERFAALATAAARLRPQRIRLLSSDKDPYLEPTRKLSRALRARHIAHELRVVPGPHDYAFNRGPGALDMLWYHDRALRGE